MDVTEQEVNVSEERESLCSDERVAEIAPPFSDEQFVNFSPERVICDGMEVNSNTPPFPALRVMFVMLHCVRESVSSDVYSINGEPS